MDTKGTAFYNRWRKQQRHRLLVRAIAAVLILSALLVLPRFLKPPTPQVQTSATSGNTSQSQSASQFTSATPDYTTLTPDHKQVNWQRSVLPSGSTAYVYADDISGIPITVSEQPLPANLASDPMKLEEIARGYHATRFITVDGAKVFIGMPLKGIQAVLFTKSNLLVLMKSTSVLNDAQWQAYIQSLK